MRNAKNNGFFNEIGSLIFLFRREHHEWPIPETAPFAPPPMNG